MMKKIIDPKEITRLEEALDSFDIETRKKSLKQLVHLAEEGNISLPETQEIANLHCHTFYSYNGYGYSPAHIAWLGRKLGAKFMGVIDFDVLDGVDEFLDACEITGVCGTAGIETRVFIPEFSQFEINSPGEPGIAYHMGTGFSTSRVPDSAAPALKYIRQRAAQRNVQMLERINNSLSPLTLDYEAEIVPLTPLGNVTERHMVHKIAEKADSAFDDPIKFWSEKLDISKEELTHVTQDRNRFKNLLRKTLMKRGGVGYIQPDRSSFPTIDEFHNIILAAGALPCSAWLDGTSGGEQKMEELLELLIEKGVASLNIIPDRNWNIADPVTKAHKVKELNRIVDLAQSLDLPILVGTEMNAYGQKLIDDFNAPELAPLNDSFIAGAYFLYGHTQMARKAGMGYQSDWAKQHFPDRKAKNSFFESAGRLIIPGAERAQFKNITSTLSPDDVLALFRKTS